MPRRVAHRTGTDGVQARVVDVWGLGVMADLSGGAEKKAAQQKAVTLCWSIEWCNDSDGGRLLIG